MHLIASVCNPTDLCCTNKNCIGPYAPHRIGPYAQPRIDEVVGTCPKSDSNPVCNTKHFLAVMNGLSANDAFMALVNADCAKSSTRMTLAQKIASEFATACAGRMEDARSVPAPGCKRKQAPSTVKRGQVKSRQQTPGQEIRNEITDDASVGQKRKQVPKKIKEDAWFKYVGRGKPDVLCICCRSSVITPFSFHAGHVTSCKQGGATIVENIRPICGACNQSMGTENMRSFVRTHYPSNLAAFDAVRYDSVTVSVKLDTIADRNSTPFHKAWYDAL